MTPLRRFLVMQALLLWQGGFLFYTAVVVPIGTQVLGSPAGQGAITARVTDTLNAIGVVSLAVFAWEMARTRDPASRRTAARWCCWAVAFVCQVLLFAFHHLLDSYLDPGRTRVVNRPPFYPVHRLYLWTSTVLWVAMLAFSWWTIRAWAAEGIAPAGPHPRSPAEAPAAADSSPAAPPAGI